METVNRKRESRILSETLNSEKYFYIDFLVSGVKVFCKHNSYRESFNPYTVLSLIIK